MKRRSFFGNMIKASIGTVLIPDILKSIAPASVSPILPGVGASSFKLKLDDSWQRGQLITLYEQDGSTWTFKYCPELDGPFERYHSERIPG